LSALVGGFALGLALIVAIGPQNLFVLRQGVRREHVFAVAAVATVCDAALILAGATGVGTVLAEQTWLKALTIWAGAAFLIGSAVHSLWLALRPPSQSMSLDVSLKEGRRGTLASALAAAFGFALLNPQVYVETVLVLGGGAANYQDPMLRWQFAVGAMAASAVWFFGIGYGARLVSGLFAKPNSARGLNVFVGVIMLWAAARLLLG
jgi:L-lysine exporter family protein LysE/ArgO